MTVDSFPRPYPTQMTQPFWDGATRHLLRTTRCVECGLTFHYPRTFCPSCWSEDLAWSDLSGLGRVKTHTWIHRPEHPAFVPLAPYQLALVELREGPTLTTRIVDAEHRPAEVGDVVSVVYETLGKVTLVLFRVTDRS